MTIKSNKKGAKSIIGIIGLGMVGSQVKRWFELNKYSVFGFDKFKNIGSMENVLDADVVFLCLPTAHDQKSETGVDLSVIKDTVKQFKKPKIFIIKSTVPVGTTNYLQNLFKKHFFFHSPEFLTEITAWEDFSDPIFQILGYTSKSKKLVKDLIKILPDGKQNAILPSNSSEIFKFARNAFFAVKVTFANHIYDLCEAFGSDYEELKNLMHIDPWMSTHHFNVIHNNYRGFGGKCLPKDLRTLIKIFESSGIEPTLFKTVDTTNTALLKKQGLLETLKNNWLQNKGA